MRLWYRIFRFAIECVFYWSFGVVKRGEIDSVACRYGFYFFYALRSDEASSLREGFEAALQRERHTFEKTSMHDIGERVPVQNSVKIRSEAHSTGDLAQ